MAQRLLSEVLLLFVGDFMKIVFKVDESESSKLKEVLDEDPVSRLSITQKNSEALELDSEGVFVVLEGNEDICKEAREKLSEFAKEIEEKEKEEVVEALETVEQEAAEGFGSIFGGD